MGTRKRITRKSLQKGDITTARPVKKAAKLSKLTKKQIQSEDKRDRELAVRAIPGRGAVFGGKSARAASKLFKKAGPKAKAAKARVKRETGSEVQERIAGGGASKGKSASEARKRIRSGIRTLRATEGDKAAAKFVRSSQRKVFKPKSEVGKRLAKSFKKNKK